MAAIDVMCERIILSFLPLAFRSQRISQPLLVKLHLAVPFWRYFGKQFYRCHQDEQLTDEAPADKRYIAIEALDLVEPARVVVENMNDHAAIVDKNPLLLRHALT